jgi:hypothetical protein
MLIKYIRAALAFFVIVVMSGCYNNVIDQNSAKERTDIQNREALVEKQRQEAVSAYRSKFSYLAYHYTVRIYKAELNTDKIYKKTGQPIKEFSILANGGEITNFSFDATDPATKDKLLTEDDLVYVGESNYGSEYNLKPAAQEKRPGTIEFKVDPNLPYASGRVYVTFKARRAIGVTFAPLDHNFMTAYSNVVEGDFQLTLKLKEESDSLRESKKEFAVGPFFVEFDVSVSGKLKPNDVVAATTNE